MREGERVNLELGELREGDMSFVFLCCVWQDMLMRARVRSWGNCSSSSDRCQREPCTSELCEIGVCMCVHVRERDNVLLSSFCVNVFFI